MGETRAAEEVMLERGPGEGREGRGDEVTELGLCGAPGPSRGLWVPFQGDGWPQPEGLGQGAARSDCPVKRLTALAVDCGEGERKGRRAGRLATAQVRGGGGLACADEVDAVTRGWTVGEFLTFEPTNERVLVTACVSKQDLLGVPRHWLPFSLYQHQFPKNLLDACQYDGPLESPGMTRPLTSRNSRHWRDKLLPPTSSATCQPPPLHCWVVGVTSYTVPQTLGSSGITSVQTQNNLS